MKPHKTGGGAFAAHSIQVGNQGGLIMRELNESEIVSVTGGAFFIAPAVVKAATWAVATISGAAAFHFASEFVSNS